MNAGVEPKRPGDRLMHLLKLSKLAEPQGRWSWVGVATALSPIFGENMSMDDVIHHVVSAYQEAVAEPRFELGSGDDLANRLLFAPIKGPSAIELGGPASPDTAYSVEQFYNAVVMYVLGELRVSRVDWVDMVGSPALSF